MAYTKQVWVDDSPPGTGTPADAAHMNHIEDGLEASAIVADSALALGNGAIPKSLVDAAGDLLVGTADNTVGRKAIGANGTWLKVSGGAHVYSAIDAADIASGTIAQARLGSGSGGAGLKALFDDQTYKTPSVGAMSLITDPGALGADGVTLCDFTSIPATFNHLMIYFLARTDNGAFQVATLRFNNDSAANYDYEFDYGNSATPSSGNVLAATNGYAGIIPGTGQGAGAAAVFQLFIPFYKETAFHKTCRSSGGTMDTSAGGCYSFDVVSRWRSTLAISRITIGAAAGNFKTGSHAILYGII
jgi:hypothetical protein